MVTNYCGWGFKEKQRLFGDFITQFFGVRYIVPSYADQFCVWRGRGLHNCVSEILNSLELTRVLFAWPFRVFPVKTCLGIPVVTCRNDISVNFGDEHVVGSSENAFKTFAFLLKLE